MSHPTRRLGVTELNRFHFRLFHFIVMLSQPHECLHLIHVTEFWICCLFFLLSSRCPTVSARVADWRSQAKRNGQPHWSGCSTPGLDRHRHVGGRTATEAEIRGECSAWARRSAAGSAEVERSGEAIRFAVRRPFDLAQFGVRRLRSRRDAPRAHTRMRSGHAQSENGERARRARLHGTATDTTTAEDTATPALAVSCAPTVTHRRSDRIGSLSA